MIQSSSLLITGPPKTKPYNKTFLELWCHDDFPGEPVLVTDYPLSEEPSSDVQCHLNDLVSYCWLPLELHRWMQVFTRLTHPLNPNCTCSFCSPLFQIISRANPSLPSSLELSLYICSRHMRAFAPLLNPNETLLSTTFTLPVEEENLYFCKCPVMPIRSMAYSIEHSLNTE